MKNIEFKASCPDPESIRHLLRKRKIRRDCRMHQIDTYFQVPLGRLKLREIDGLRAELIHYHRADQAAARESDYVVVEVPEAAALKLALDRALGTWVVVDKVRELYLWRRTRVHLDQVVDLGTFVELETVITDQSPADAQLECEQIREALGVPTSDMLTGSYADMLSSES